MNNIYIFECRMYEEAVLRTNMSKTEVNNYILYKEENYMSQSNLCKVEKKV